MFNQWMEVEAFLLCLDIVLQVTIQNSQIKIGLVLKASSRLQKMEQLNAILNI
jgi:hypothetical protein